MVLTIEIKNVEQFKKFMQEKQAKIKQTIPQSVREATLWVHTKVKESIARGTNAPVAVDTGRFLNSVDFEPVDENSSKVFTDLEYAKYIEYGTSRMVQRPHFGNTAKKEVNEVKEIMNANIKKI